MIPGQLFTLPAPTPAEIRAKLWSVVSDHFITSNPKAIDTAVLALDAAIAHIERGAPISEAIKARFGGDLRAALIRAAGSIPGATL